MSIPEPINKASTVINGVKIDVEHTIETPETIWERKHEIHAEYVKAKEDYEKLTEDQILSAQERLAKTLELAATEIHNVLPFGVDLDEEGNMLTLHLHVLFADLDEDSKRRREETIIARRRAMEEAEKLASIGLDDET